MSVSAVSSTVMSALSSTPSTTQVGAAAGDSQFNEFLQLLTAQLQNQDPMNPADPTQFVAELAQFSQVEQQVQTNTTLTGMNSTLGSLALGQYAGMIGHNVTATATSVTLPLAGSSTSVDYSVTNSALNNIQVQVTNSSGTVVRTLSVSGSSGTVSFDGNDANGNPLPSGSYGISLVGTDSTNTSQSAGTLSSTGTVSSVQQDSSGNWQLQLEDGRVVSATSVTDLS